MQFSLPSRRRVTRFVVVFYAATALLFFGFFAVLGLFGGFSFTTVYLSLVWPTALVMHELHATLLGLGVTAALVEPRVMEAGD